jgi:fibronectin-binding autotransporter adhesin
MQWLSSCSPVRRPVGRSLSQRVLSVGIASCLLLPTISPAVDYDWSGALTGTASWNTGNNWLTLPVDDTLFPNGIGDFANISPDLTGNLTVNLLQGITLGRLDFGDATGAQTLNINSGTGTVIQTLTFAAAAGNAELRGTGSGTGANTINPNLLLQSNLDIYKSTHQINLNGLVDLGSNTLRVLAGTGTANVFFGNNGNLTQGLISGAGSVVLDTGSNTNLLALFAPNTYSGGTTVQSGMLVVGVDSTGPANTPTNGALGTGTLTMNGGAIRATSNGNRTVANRVTLGGDFTLGDATTTVVTFTGDATLTGNRTLTIGNGSLATNAYTFSGPIGDGGNGFGLTVQAPTNTPNGAGVSQGVLQLSGASTYSGPTTVLSGQILLGSDAPAGAPGSLGNSTTAVALGGVGSSLSDNVSLLTSQTVNVTVGRNIVVNADNEFGLTRIGTAGAAGAVFNGTITLNKSVSLFSNSTGTNVAAFNGVITDGAGIFTVEKRGTGVVELNTAGNSFDGGVTISEGTLRLGALGAQGTGAIGFNNIGVASATLQLGGALNFAQPITITGGSTGATTLSASNAAGTTAIYSGPITLNKTATLSNATAGATTRFTGVIDDSFDSLGVIVTGPGTVEFGGAAANTYNGLTTVSSGTLLLNSTAAGGAIIGDADTATPDVLINGGTLLFGANHQLAMNTTIQLSSGALDLAGRTQTIFDLDYTGGAILNAGGLTITNGTDLFLFDGTNIAANQNLSRNVIFAGQVTGGTISGNLALAPGQTHTFAVNDSAAAVDLEVTGTISNATTPVSIQKSGNGVLRLSAPGGNTFGGAGQTVTLEGGFLSVNADNLLGNAANSITFAGGQLRFETAFATNRAMNVTAAGGGIDTPTGVTVTISGTGQIAGTGDFVKTGPGTLLITGNQSASWLGGNAVVAEGVLRISAENQLGSDFNGVIFRGGTLQITNGFTPSTGRVFTLGTGGGTLLIDAAQTVRLDGTGVIVGNSVLTKAGPGSLVITGFNTGLNAGAGVNVAEGTLELENAQSLGGTTKALIGLSGGNLVLRNDFATTFGNPLSISSGTITSEVLTVGSPGVTHTLGAASLNGTLNVAKGANVIGGSAAVTTGTVTLGGPSTINTAADTLITAPVVAGGTTAGTTALTKTGAGRLITGASTYTGNTVANGGILQANSVTSFGPATAGNVVKINAGKLAMNATGMAYALEFNGGTLAATGGDRTWNALPGPTPSLTFTQDTVFDMVDPLNPDVEWAVNMGLAGAAGNGVPTSTGPVNITINNTSTVNVGLTAGFNAKKVRFQQDALPGSVTGTLTVNQNAVGQIRGSGENNGFGADVVIKLNTGVNLATPINSGRLELISEVDTNFRNRVELLADSTIAVGRATSGTNRTMTIGDLVMGAAQVLSTADVTSGGSGYRLAVGGVTTLSGDTTFSTGAPLILAEVTDGSGSFSLTKRGGSSLTLNGPLNYNGNTVVEAGTLIFAGSQLSPGLLTINGGSVQLASDNAIADATNIVVNAGTMNFSQGLNTARTDTVANITLANAGALLRTANGTASPTTSTLTITGAFISNFGDWAVNSAANINANSVSLTGGLNVIGGNTALQVNELIVGAGGLQMDGARIDMDYQLAGSRIVLNGNLTVTGDSASSIVPRTGASGVKELALGAQPRTFDVADGLADVDFSVGVDVVGTGGIVKQGPGTMALTSPANTYSGGTNVLGGGLLVQGAVTGDVSLGAGTRLGGVGTIAAAIKGAGRVNPGNLTGVMQADSIDSSSGLDFLFEFSQLGSPTYFFRDFSGNDVLYLSGSTGPAFASPLTGENQITADFSGFFGLEIGQKFRGGLFATAANLAAFKGNVENATFSFTGLSGLVTDFDVEVVPETADFGLSFIDGYTLEFTAIPEPGTLISLIGGLGALLGLQRFRRRHL